MKLMSKILLLVTAVLFLFGCATKQPLNLPAFNAMQFDKNAYTSKVDTFLVVFDASSSMTHNNKFEIAKAVAERMNATLPEMSQIAGLRSFGHSPNVTKKDTELFYGMGSYTTSGLQGGLDKITEAGGPSPMYKAIDEAVNDFSGFEGGKSAVIFITDGLDLPGDILASAKNLKSTYGDSICFYPILVGNDPAGEKLLEGIAKIGKCSYIYSAEEILTSNGMADFIKAAFLDAKAAAPTPKSAPKPAPKPAAGPKDSDNDGVTDALDQCPNTPMGAPVTSAGCWVLDNVLFDFDKDVIKPEAYGLLKNAADILKKNPSMNVELHGHCDNHGTERYNKGLSERRANAVKHYLNSKGVVLSRMKTKGYGFSRPVSTNDSEMGRAQNRRVEIHPIY